MTSLPPTSATPESATATAAKPALVRAGRLAGGAIIGAWLISALYHLGLFFVMYAVPWFAEWSRSAPDAPPPFTSVIGEVNTPVASLTPSPSPGGLMKSPSQQPPVSFQNQQPLPASPSGKGDALKILGIGTAGRDSGGGDFTLPSGRGEGKLDGISGIGTGGGGDGGFSIPFSGSGPNFFGLGGEARGARNVVYVVDRSGSMLNTFGGVVKELKQSIGALRRSQRFHLIFFNSGAPLENPPRRMVSAIAAQKEAAFQFLQGITPAGDTDPRPALRRAFAVEPDLIYFLTDGEFEEYAQSLFAMLDQLNKQRKVRIFTIAYVNQAGGVVLERIAREHDGEYRFVSEDEIF